MIQLIQQLAVRGEPADDGGLELLLELADSTMTYRGRYQAAPQLPAVLDLLLCDETNPRSAVFQILTLSDHMASLPNAGDDGIMSADRKIVMRLGSELRLADRDRARLDGEPLRRARRARSARAPDRSRRARALRPHRRAVLQSFFAEEDRRRAAAGIAAMMYDIRHRTTFTYEDSRLGVAPRAAPRAAPPSAAASARDRDADRSVAGRGFAGQRLLRQPGPLPHRAGASRPARRRGAFADRRAAAAGSARSRRERAVGRDARVARGRRRRPAAPGLPVRVRLAVLGRERRHSRLRAAVVRRRAVPCSRPRWTSPRGSIASSSTAAACPTSRRPCATCSRCAKASARTSRIFEIACLRSIGLAARYVSGYSAHASARGQGEARRRGRIARVALGLVAEPRLGRLRSDQQRDPERRAHHDRLGPRLRRREPDQRLHRRRRRAPGRRRGRRQSGLTLAQPDSLRRNPRRGSSIQVW